MKINVLPEFKNLIPPLSEEEFNLLEQSCIKEGIREQLVLAEWVDKETGELVTALADGHNRFEISEKHNIPFDTNLMKFESKEEVMEWMDKNQLGRRNLNPSHFKILIGRFYNRMKKAANGRGDRNFGVEKNTTLKTSEVIGKEFGVTEKTVRNAAKQQSLISQAAAEIDKSEFEIIDSIPTDKVINNAAKIVEQGQGVKVSDALEIAKKEYEQQKAAKTKKREQVKQTLEKLDLLSFTKGNKYRVIYADPPWSYNDKKNVVGYGAVDDHYISMGIEELCAMPVKEIAEENAVLFLWTTSPLLEKTFDLINSWGFKYKTSFVWDKVKHNMGHYNSVRHEFLLICTRGSCTPDKKQLFDSVQEIERTNVHSEKPVQFREIIETLYTWGNKIELFSRSEAKGWTIFGNQKLEKI